MSDRRPDRRLRDSADIVFSASVQAESVRFTSVPWSEITFHGEPGEESAAGSRREGLPDRVAEGETYRAIRIDYTIASKLTSTRETGDAREPGERRRDGRVGRDIQRGDP